MTFKSTFNAAQKATLASVTSLGLAAIAILATMGTASATNPGPAWSSASLNVRTGPSVAYSRVDTLHRGEQVQVHQCQSGWCYVTHRGPDGWVSSRYLRFGQAAPHTPPQAPPYVPPQTYPTPPHGQMPHHGNPPYSPPNNPNYGGNSHAQITIGGSFSFGNWPHVRLPQPQVCVFSGPNYTGNRACARPGRTFPTLGSNWNNSISSVRISHGAQVTLCNRRHYQGFCRVVASSENQLGGWLNDRVSSLKVH